jgi:hypothetical protein
MPTFHKNHLAIINTADVTGGKLIAVRSQSISGVNAITPLVAFYDILGRKREVPFYYFVLNIRHRLRDIEYNLVGNVI